MGRGLDAAGEEAGGSHRRALTVNADELLRDPGSSRTIEATVPAMALGIDDERFAGDVSISVTVDATNDRLLARGEFTVPYRDTCARCLTPIEQTLEVTTFEQYSETPPPDDPEAEDFLESFPIENGRIDLAPMIRESLLLARPDAPQCRNDCRGLCPVCGTDWNAASCDCDATVRDDRWAVLDELRDQL